MGQKVNPVGLRLNVNKTWDSRWFADKNYAGQLLEDLKIRAFLDKELKKASVSRIVIERVANKVNVVIFSSQPGLIIGKKGADIDNLKKKLARMTKSDVNVNIVEVRRADVDAVITAKSIASQIERRISFKKAMKKAVQNALRSGAKGIRVSCAGRLNGAEIAREEWYREGRVPLHTLRADIDYGYARAETTYGVIGVRVWIYRGDVVGKEAIATSRKSSSTANDKAAN
ncbi:MAG: 30S ribosomal protein S3 [Alphaproteobacteria bacterium]|nr:30S ribosomal protein S3 [Alphaproteobacteria bacterium]MBQ8660220.1 30S ribosomal protein S3 [Alphaproteobacteria bacterium]MBR4315542.1 30S ribosomal protein S3 [Alphaproteobacteria bacterium]